MSLARRDALIAPAALLGAALGAPLPASACATVGSPAAADAGSDPAAIAADLARYDGFGTKRSGGPGDEAVRLWMAEQLAALGFTVSYAAVQAPAFEVDRADLVAQNRRVAVEPQAIVVPTPEGGITAPAALVADPSDLARVAGRIAVVMLPHRRHSALMTPTTIEAVRAAVAAGARAVVAVTHGPTGETIVLNAPADAPAVSVPMAVVGPRPLAPLVELIRRGSDLTLTITGTGSRRTAQTLIARKPGIGPMLVVSTPRSGWTVCAGERGPGVAIFLDLARWAATRWPQRSLLFVSASGHEYDNQGMDAFLKSSAAPRPQEVALWVHLGANIATTDFHDLGPLRALPSADPQRFLVGPRSMLPVLQQCFAGQAGLEAPYPVEAGAAGELAHILAEGYTRALGVFGAGRLHHVETDRLPLATNPQIVAAAAGGFRKAIVALLDQAT